MKHTKMSRRSHHSGSRESSRALRTEMEHEQSVRLEQQRIDFERRAHMARNNLYGLGTSWQPSGWVDSRRH